MLSHLAFLGKDAANTHSQRAGHDIHLVGTVHNYVSDW